MPLNLLKLIRRFTFLSDKKRLELYPPFWLMRIKVIELAPDWQTVRIKLPLNMVSRNVGNSMFGGYQASLSDPIAALACAKRFPGHEVWTRRHEVDFQKVGNEKVTVIKFIRTKGHVELCGDLGKNSNEEGTREHIWLSAEQSRVEKDA